MCSNLNWTVGRGAAHANFPRDAPQPQLTPVQEVPSKPPKGLPTSPTNRSYGSFTEGFDTLDLRQAKALLGGPLRLSTSFKTASKFVRGAT